MKIPPAILLLLIPLLAVSEDKLPPEVNAVRMGAGLLFVDQDGLTLYTYKRDREQPGSSVCVADCAELWPPVPAAPDADNIGDWSIISRQDGSRQWTYKSSPVYRHARDKHPGAMIGEKASVFWDVLFEPINTPPGIAISGSLQGQILVDLHGSTVYTSASNSCDVDCQKSWHPLEAPWLGAISDEDWAIIRHLNGTMQWTYKHQLLFTYAGNVDSAAAIVAQGNQDWKVLVLQDAIYVPDWVTYQETDFGPVFADANRMTLYYLVNDAKQIARETCDQECEQDNWRPTSATEASEPVGNWSTLKLANGQYQWTYLGLPVFTYKHDAIPGDTRGNKFAAGASVRGGWMAILKDTLVQNLN